jgi:hypothetical protein
VQRRVGAGRGVPPGDGGFSYQGHETVRDEPIASANEDDVPRARGWSTHQRCDQQAIASPQGRDHAPSLVAEPGLRRDLSRPPLSFQPVERRGTRFSS